MKSLTYEIKVCSNCVGNEKKIQNATVIKTIIPYGFKTTEKGTTMKIISSQFVVVLWVL